MSTAIAEMPDTKKKKAGVMHSRTWAPARADGLPYAACNQSIVADEKLTPAPSEVTCRSCKRVEHLQNQATEVAEEEHSPKFQEIVEQGIAETEETMRLARKSRRQRGGKTMNNRAKQMELPGADAPAFPAATENPISAFVNRTKPKTDHFTLCVRRGDDGGIEEPISRYVPSIDLDARIWAAAERRARGCEALSVAFVLRAHAAPHGDVNTDGLVASRCFSISKSEAAIAIEALAAKHYNRAPVSLVLTWVRQPVSSMNRAAVPDALRIRETNDPHEEPPVESVGGPERSWAELYGEAVAAVWSHRIAKKLADGTPRTFHRIMVELTGYGADTCVGTAAEAGLWNLVDAGELAHTLEAPILFSAIEHSTVEADRTSVCPHGATLEERCNSCAAQDAAYRHGYGEIDVSELETTPISEGPEGSIDTSP